MFFEVTLAVDKLNEKGEAKRVIERYITDDTLFGGVEQKALGMYGGECEVTAIKISKITEIVNDKTDNFPFFKAVVYDVFTTDSGEEKEIDYQMLVCAEDVKTATNTMLEYMKQGYGMGLKSVSRTKIIDVIK